MTTLNNNTTQMVRDSRQKRVLAWARDCFGPDAINRKERAKRVLEEAIELAQLEGISPGEIQDLTRHVYEKPVGLLDQEIGGISVTLLAYSQLAGISTDLAERVEIERIFALPREHFRERHAAKVRKGLATGYDK